MVFQMSSMVPWDQRIAQRLVRPLVNTPIRPNHITLLTVLLALTGAGLLTSTDSVMLNWGAGIFAFSRFLDHFDGELARQGGQTSHLGYLLDYFAGGLSYAALFACMSYGQYQGGLGNSALLLGAAGTACALIAVWLNLQIDALNGDGDDAVGYPSLAGFELEDGIYLLAPVTWMGWLSEFYFLSCCGAVVYLLWTLNCLMRQRAQ
jgi:phosphatidylglycerophosphate synthase